MIDAFLERNDEFEVERLTAGEPDPWTARAVQLLPSRDGTDGFFIARLRRKA